MIENIKKAISLIEEHHKEKPIKIISHYDTDGITSASILAKAMQRWQKKFSLEIIKNLEEEYIKNLAENNILIFLDLGSGSLAHLKNKKTEIIILDHHEIPEKDIPKNVILVNPVLNSDESISAAGISYLFAKTISSQNKDLANLAVIGMVGDQLEKNINKTYTEILKDADATIKKGLLLYPSTRPLNKTLEYSSNPYIPNITGCPTGVFELLRDAGIKKENGRYKSISELDKEEMKGLITALMLKIPSHNPDELIGNIYLIKFHNRMEDAREISALINACSRMDNPKIALGFCLNNKNSKEEAEKIYIEYKQHIVSALKYVSETEKISGKNYSIINAKDNIKDTIIGTIASILSHSPVYKEGTIIVALAYNENKIKVSARMVGKEGRNIREVLHKVAVPLGGEVGGHPSAAGCLITREHEETFINELKKALELEIIKV